MEQFFLTLDFVCWYVFQLLELLEQGGVRRLDEAGGLGRSSGGRAVGNLWSSLKQCLQVEGWQAGEGLQTKGLVGECVFITVPLMYLLVRRKPLIFLFNLCVCGLCTGGF